MKEAKIIMVMVIMVVAKEIVHQTMKEHPKFKKNEKCWYINNIEWKTMLKNESRKKTPLYYLHKKEKFQEKSNWHLDMRANNYMC